MTVIMTKEQREALAARYERAVHARQSAVAYALAKGDRSMSPKRLRVGIDGALSDASGLARLLIAKGIFTEDEYQTAIVEAAEQEAESWAQRVRRDYGLPDNVSFG